MLHRVMALLLPVPTALATAGDSLPSLFAASGNILDEHGRIRIFHGFNDVGEAKGVGTKRGGPQYQPRLVMDPNVRSQLAEWGFNAIRLPMMWSGVALEDGVYDEAYLATMAGVVDDLAAHSIWSLLDMHQDVLSSTLGEYDGSPQWLVNRTARRHDYPWPVAQPLRSWEEGYLAEATGQCFQEIYSNTHGGLDAWSAFWRQVAGKMVGRPGVLGYELINEPWCGDIYARPSLLLPGVAGRDNLQPSYDTVAAAIREVDGNSLIFYEPVTWGMIFPGSGVLGSGFDHVPGGAAYANRSALSYHYYCWLVTTGDQNISGLQRRACDDAFGPRVFKSVAEDVARLGGASMLTEFGAATPSAARPHSANTDQVFAVGRLADAHFQSWTYWDMHDGFFNATTGKWNLDAVLPLVRTYAQAIAGEPRVMTFDPMSAAFHLAFRADPVAISHPTEVVAPRVLYPSGFTVSTGGDAGLTWQAHPSRPGVLLISASARGEAVFNITKREASRVVGNTGVLEVQV